MKKIILVILLLAPLFGIHAQSNELLQTPISLNFENVRVKKVFDEISSKSDLIFSYGNLNENELISIHVDNYRLYKVLDILEKEMNVTIVVKGKYAIVKPLKINDDLTISGTVWDNNNNPVSDASIYVKSLKRVVNSNEQGDFKIKIPSGNKVIKINFAKQNYVDTTVVLVSNKNQSINIHLNAYTNATIEEFEKIQPSVKMLISGDSIEPLPTLNTVLWTEIENDNINLKNIRDTFFSNFSFSLFPPISTNKLLSFHTRNAVAINLIGGQSKGVSIMELGGAFNIDHGNVQFLQAAGISNIVFGHASGIQAAGVFNTVRKNMNGLQVAPSFNFVDSTTNGLQISGFYQYSNKLNGLQIAGVYNKAKYVKGVQISGLVNQADTLTGVQLGIINISNRLKNGLPIGLFNYVKDGYHKLELSYDDLGFYQLGFRSGVNYLHMHYRFGGQKIGDKTIVSTSFGLASSLKIVNGLYLEMDAVTGNFHDLHNLNGNKFNMKNQFLLGFSLQPLKKLGIRFGATVNHFWYDPSNLTNTDVASLIHNPIYKTIHAGKEHSMWLGYQIGLVIF